MAADGDGTSCLSVVIIKAQYSSTKQGLDWPLSSRILIIRTPK